MSKPWNAHTRAKIGRCNFGVTRFDDPDNFVARDYGAFRIRQIAV
jgi:hypothetical protein